MKKIISLVLMVAMLATSVMATETTLDDASITMAMVDVQTVEFCMNSSFDGSPLDAIVVVDPICRDANSLEGCQPADSAVPADDFSVVPVDATTGADGCVDLTITTGLESGEEGLFYYTVNGFVGEVDASAEGSETGMVFVPEFGVVAAGLALAGAGVYIAKRRKK